MYIAILMDILNINNRPGLKKALMTGCALVFITLAANGAEGFRSEFVNEKVGRPDWLSVYTHLSGLVQVKLAPVEGQPFTHAATVEMMSALPDSVAGKGTYMRSRAISAGSNQFAVEWSENIHPDIAGPQFELWGEVGKNPNEYSRLLLRLFRKAEGPALQPGSAPLVQVEPGWRRFKIVVSAQENTFDLYYEDMERAVATGLPLQETIESTERLGIGFVWYLSPNTPITQWQVGGISLLPLP